MRNASFSLKKPEPEALNIGGLTPFTTIDFPGQLAAVLFTQGCPWRCDYCHNKPLLARQGDRQYRWQEVIDFLQKRVGLIDAVVISGGEPTLQRGLRAAIGQIRELGFKVGLHTAGIYPGRLAEVLPVLDWVGLDIKSAYAHYDAITGVPGSADRAWSSAGLLVESGIDYEVRTTLHPVIMEEDNLAELVAELSQLGVSNYCVQRCNLDFCSSPQPTEKSLARLDQSQHALLAETFEHFSVRGQGLVI